MEQTGSRPAWVEHLSDALVSEIKAEAGRRDLSSRALGRLIGESSQYMSMRLDGGNPRTGERVMLNVRDLTAIASALDLVPAELMHRARLRAIEMSEAAAISTRDDVALAASDMENFADRYEEPDTP